MTIIAPDSQTVHPYKISSAEPLSKRQNRRFRTGFQPEKKKSANFLDAYCQNLTGSAAIL